MRLLIFDTIFPIGHKSLNTRLLSYIESFASVTVVNRRGYIESETSVATTDFVYPSMVDIAGKGRLHSQLVLLRNFLSALASVNLKNYDAIIFFTFDTLNFAIELPLLKRKPVYLIHHRNTAELQNRTKAKVFKTYCNKVHHIVFAQFIADYLINDMGVRPELVHVLPHPILLQAGEPTDGIVKSGNKIFIAIAYSNDEGLIDKIVAYEEKTQLLLRNNIKLVMRWNREPYSNKSIEIIQGHLSEADYSRLYRDAMGVVLPYPQWYKNRFSGAIMDSIFLKKPVIGSDIAIFREFENQYSAFCSHFSSVEDLFDRLISVESLDRVAVEKDYNKFLENHSNEIICKTLKQIVVL